MSTVVYLGKALLRASGAKITGESAKSATKTLQDIVKGQPKGAKKRFYRALNLFIKNPENAAAEQYIRETVENSPVVARQLDKECAEAVAKARKMAEEAAEASVKERKIAEEAFSQKTSGQILDDGYVPDFKDAYEKTAREAFGYTYQARKKLVALPISQSIISPVRMHHGIEQARKVAIARMRNMDIPMPSINLTREEINKVVNEAIRESFKESTTLTTRAITYPFNKFASLFLPKNLKAICKDIMHLPRENFGKEFYTRLIQSKGLTGRAPAGITVIKKEELGIADAGFDFFNNTLYVSDKFTKYSRATQANLLSHELKHFEQTDAIIRTFGIEKYIEALKAKTLKNLKSNILNCGKSEKELLEAVNKQFKNLEPKIKEAFASSIQAEKIAPNSAIGKRANKYLKSLSNYETPDQNNPLNPLSVYRYYNNGLEKGAYKTGLLTKFFTSFLERLNLKTA